MSCGTTGMPCSHAKSVAPWPTRRLGGTLLRDNGRLEASKINRARLTGFLISESKGLANKDHCRQKSIDLRAVAPHAPLLPK